MIWLFIRANWRWLALVAAVTGFYVFAYHHGRASERVSWERKYIAAEKSWQANATKESKALEAKLTDMRKKESALRKKIQDEIKDTVYDSCIVPPGGLQLLRDAYEGATG